MATQPRRRRATSAGRLAGVAVAALVGLAVQAQLAVAQPRPQPQPQPAPAPGGGTGIGDRLGDLLQGWAVPLFGGICAIIAVVLIVNRRMTELAAFAVIALIAGAFVFAPDAVGGTITDIVDTVTGR